jgi:hypothetical protein
MVNFTQEQLDYINFDQLVDTKLIATAGSGKTFTIIQRMKHLIENEILNSDNILMLTFSRFTRDDFINRIRKHSVTCINENHIKTIDSFAKSIIDPNNEVDVSILSYKFMKYLENTSAKDIRKNKNISSIKSIFVDEAQDLNETQFLILHYLKKKNKTVINLIGDPNQNIYQFRSSSDKYLNEFNAKTFYLTRNFRSHQEIVNFSKHLRPEKTINVSCHLGKAKSLPVSVFYEDEADLEFNLIKLLKTVMEARIDLSDFAILAPTRGRMRSNGRSNGLCFITNILFKNGIKFKQFYEESSDELTGNISYQPTKGHINVLTYMGSKGLEWKYTIIIDAETCLINKRNFTKEIHKHDQYLLYVACSRAIKNLFIFSRCYLNKKIDKYTFCLNPWFSLIPEKYYICDERYQKYFEFSQVEEKIINIKENRVYKLIDQCSEEDLFNLAKLCEYGIEDSKSVKETFNVYTSDEFNQSIHVSSFASKYIKELFISYFNISHDLPHKRYSEIESIINLNLVMSNLSQNFLYWFFKNRYDLTWEKFDREKSTYSKEIVETIEKYFKREKELGEHLIAPDCYFKSFILSEVTFLKDVYNSYLECKDIIEIRNYLFIIIVYIYSLETQHYYHIKNEGSKFSYVLDDQYTDIYNKMYLFVQKKIVTVNKFNVAIPKNKYELQGGIDFIDDKMDIWEIKCSCNSNIGLKDIVKQTVYSVLHRNLDESSDIKLNFINIVHGIVTQIKLKLTKEKIDGIMGILLKNKQKNLIV